MRTRIEYADQVEVTMKPYICPECHSAIPGMFHDLECSLYDTDDADAYDAGVDGDEDAVT